MNLFGARDPRDLPAYTIAEAARYARMSPAKLRRWIKSDVIACHDEGYLSFTNLVEAHVLASIISQHKVRLARVRPALSYVQDQLGVERPLIRQEFETDGVDLFVQQQGVLVNASKAGQIAARDIIKAHLNRIEWDERGLVRKLFPIVRTDSAPSAPKLVSIDPAVQFGRPVIVGTAIRTSVIAMRYQRGESAEELAYDYDCELEAVEEALRAEMSLRVA